MVERELVAVNIPIGLTYIGLLKGEIKDGESINLVKYVCASTKSLENGNYESNVLSLYQKKAKLPEVQLKDLERKVIFLRTIDTFKGI